MTWNYRLIKSRTGFAGIEVYYDGRTPKGWSGPVEPTVPGDAELMLTALKRPVFSRPTDGTRRRASPKRS